MKTMLFRVSLMAAVVILCQGLDGSEAQAQSGSRSKTRSGLVQEATQPARNKIGNPSAMQKSGVAAAAKPKSPWKISSRIHLEKGTNNGYLVVQIDLDKGYHVYSLDPKSSPAPTQLAVLPSNDLRVKSKFVSDKSPLVIEKDPVFGKRIEKHTGQVQFFAPIEVRAGVDLQKLSQDVKFSGQVCSSSACQPIRQHTANAKFAGYFEIPKTGNNAAQGQQQLK